MKRLERTTSLRIAAAAAMALAGSGAAGAALAGQAEFVRLEGGTFEMGSERHYREEGPVREVTVGPFLISTTEVTNEQFARFVDETGHVTTAERGLDPQPGDDQLGALSGPGAMVFAPPAGPISRADPRRWWRYVEKADWRRPEGSASSIRGRNDHPVVQVSYQDAEAYAAWAGGRLPTEAEWEFAARGGLEGAAYVWGDVYHPVEGWKANSWQGMFPWQDEGLDGFRGTAPVRSFEPNGYGLYDMAGNVWEMVADFWVPGHPQEDQAYPSGPSRALAARFSHPAVGARRVLKGGSFLCARTYCQRYRPAARQPFEERLGSSHVGFRIVKDVPGKSKAHRD